MQGVLEARHVADVAQREAATPAFGVYGYHCHVADEGCGVDDAISGGEAVGARPRVDQGGAVRRERPRAARVDVCWKEHSGQCTVDCRRDERSGRDGLSRAK